jgi:hypothetical protein
LVDAAKSSSFPILALSLRKHLHMPETVSILAAGTAVLAILFGARLALRAMSSDAAAASPSGAGASDVAGVVALPPFIFLGFLAAATVLEAVVALPVAAEFPAARYVAGRRSSWSP